MATHRPVSIVTTISSLIATSATNTEAMHSSTTFAANARHIYACCGPGGPALLYPRLLWILLKPRPPRRDIFAIMLVWGTANPEGLKDSYRGVYLNAGDITSMVQQVDAANRQGPGIPVKLEHTGVSLGRVVSAWENQGRLDCVLEINERVLEGSISAEFVRAGICKDLSLGYTVVMEQSKTGTMQSRTKRLNEISIVVKGARNKCNVHGISAAGPAAGGALPRRPTAG